MKTDTGKPQKRKHFNLFWNFIKFQKQKNSLLSTKKSL